MRTSYVQLATDIVFCESPIRLQPPYRKSRDYRYENSHVNDKYTGENCRTHLITPLFKVVLNVQKVYHYGLSTAEFFKAPLTQYH